MRLTLSKYVLTVYRIEIQWKDNILFHKHHGEIKGETKRKIYKRKAEIKTSTTYLERCHTEERRWE
jgi:hypothetical protein